MTVNLFISLIEANGSS